MTYHVHKTCNASGPTHPDENKRTEGHVVCRLKIQRTTGQQSKKTKLCYVNIIKNGPTSTRRSQDSSAKKTKLCYVNIIKNGPTSPPKILEFRKLCYVIYISTA